MYADKYGDDWYGDMYNDDMYADMYYDDWYGDMYYDDWYADMYNDDWYGDEYNDDWYADWYSDDWYGDMYYDDWYDDCGMEVCEWELCEPEAQLNGPETCWREYCYNDCGDYCNQEWNATNMVDGEWDWDVTECPQDFDMMALEQAQDAAMEARENFDGSIEFALDTW